MARRQTAGPGHPAQAICGPVRTCIGCRGQDARAAMLRVVVDVASSDGLDSPAVLRPDPGRVLPGRGASVHLDRGCFEAAVRRRAFARALRVAGPVDAEPVRRYLFPEPAPAAGSASSAGPAAPGSTPLPPVQRAGRVTR